jgi:hypothetical protein
MTRSELVTRAFEVFRHDANAPPPLTLRGGERVDSYDYPEPFDPDLDAPTDEYIERFAYHAMPFLDAQSWRHYLPRLIDHAFRRPDEPTGLVLFALVHSLRPPDREPPRLATLTQDQDAVITIFLEELIRDPAYEHEREDAEQAIAEWWSPNARLRPTAAELEAKRWAPVTYHEVGGSEYRVTLPTTFMSSGLRHVPSESRRVESWSGYLAGDAPARFLVHFELLGDRTLGDAVRRATDGLVETFESGTLHRLNGARRAQRIDGLMRGYSQSPVELERVILVVAVVGAELLTVRVTSWPRPDVEAEMEKIIASLRLA